VLETNRRELRSAKYECRITNYECRIANYEVRMLIFELRKSPFEGGFRGMLLFPCTSKPKIFNRKGRRERKEIRMSKCELRSANYELRKSPFEGGFMAKAIPSGGGCYCHRAQGFNILNPYFLWLTRFLFCSHWLTISVNSWVSSLLVG